MERQTSRQIVLEDNLGEVVRYYPWDGRPVQVVRRGDSLRLELVSSTDQFKKDRIPFEVIGSVNEQSLVNKPLSIGTLGALRILPKIEIVATDDRPEKENNRLWNASIAGMLLLALGMITVMVLRPPVGINNEEAMKQEVIKIVKNIPPRQKVAPATVNHTTTDQEVKTTTKSPDRLKRMGALAALGSLSKSKQVGGLNLGAAVTSAGPGLGGNAGSGGTQTSLYAKGLTSAPLGAGNRVEGAGGYGTKGKGGGQAGYGKMTMVGSTGAAPIGLSQEASIATGLDRDAIAAVINRNLGQVRFCYEQGLQGDPNLNGRVAVGFTIGGNGAVTTASVENSSLNSKMIEECIVMRLKSWKFPLPQGGVDVKVSYPFVLRRTGQG